MNYNLAILGGRIAKTPELKTTQSGIPVTAFTVAINRPKNKDGEQQADFINVVAWRGTAEFVTKYFDKGDAILVEGKIQTRSYTDNNGNKRYAVEVVADRVDFVESKKASNTIPQQAEMPQDADFVPVEDDEDLPF